MNLQNISFQNSGLERLSTEGTNREKGTGLGFLITKELVNKLGGTLSGESLPGQGSPFTISLPVLGNTL